MRYNRDSRLRSFLDRGPARQERITRARGRGGSESRVHWHSRPAGPAAALQAEHGCALRVEAYGFRETGGLADRGRGCSLACTALAAAGLGGEPG